MNTNENPGTSHRHRKPAGVICKVALILLLSALLPWKGFTQESRPTAAKPIEWITEAARGQGLERHLFTSKIAGSKVSFHVFKPIEYSTEKTRRFPVLYWLHGSGGGIAGVRPLARHFGQAMAAKKIPPFIVVFPNGLRSGMWCDSHDGRTPIETMLTKELIPFVDANFRTLATAKKRIIEGFSMGGYGAARLGFKHPKLFGAISILGGGPLQKELKNTPRASPASRRRLLKTIYGNKQSIFQAMSPFEIAIRQAKTLRQGILIRQYVGDKDETLPANKRFHHHLTRLKIPHTFKILPDVPHNPRALFRALGDGNWEFYKAFLKVKPTRRRTDSTSPKPRTQ